MRKLIVYSLLLVLTCLSVPVSAVQEDALRIGVLAFRPKAQTLEQWQALLHYLEAKLGRPVSLTPYHYTELNSDIHQQHVDVVVTNPGHYILLRQRHGLSAPLATLVVQEGAYALSNFGGVIFTRQDASRIRTLEDIPGKHVAAVSKDSFGGYQMQAFTLMQAGLALPKREDIVFTGMPHDNVVEAVLSGRAEVGFVRSGILESLAHEGQLDMAQIKLVHAQQWPDFPYQVSTELYPEWVVATMPHVDADTARQLTIALLSFDAGVSVARQNGLQRFTIPADYSKVEKLLRWLRMPPFDTTPEFTIVDLWHRYTLWIVTLCILGLLLAALTAALFLQNKRVKQAMRYNRSLIEACLDPLVTISKAGKITDVNTATVRVTGVPREKLMGSDFSDYFTDPPSARAGYQKVFAQGMVNDYPLAIRHSDGHITDVLYNASLYKNEQQQVEGVFAAARDISERKLFEDALRDREERLALATLHNGVGIWDWNLQTREIVWDDSMFALYHLRREDFSGIDAAWRQSLHPDDLERGNKELLAALAGKKPFNMEFRICWPTGEVRYIKAVAKMFRDPQGKPLRMLGTNIDITDRMVLQQELERQAHVDYLTGVSSRRYFMEQAEQELNRALRYGKALSLFMLDLDYFKQVNDSYGHRVGDAVLKKLGDVCRETLREVDIVGRVGGEEFAILLPETAQEEAVEVAERLRVAVSQATVTLDAGGTLCFSVSIGVTAMRASNDNIDILLNKADQALYQAKKTGRNKVMLTGDT